ncbi:unnamed protein product [Chondrus crispus]|uniref:Uncharacterized protein n=1 Tax=Chondrus crispus TaxID=2769 RepID=R7QKL9_CHOCR|nr:unnamed protein product [Chondrus crispus]CDF38624.1 unnamed protein product [Chondrus crispus]|eukprot:XP_005718529.1 unnamed protein product [Chondrus crispus]
MRTVVPYAAVHIQLQHSCRILPVTSSRHLPHQTVSDASGLFHLITDNTKSFVRATIKSCNSQFSPVAQVLVQQNDTPTS